MLNIHAHGLFATIMMFYGPLNWEIGLLNIGLFFEGYLRIAVQKGVTSVTLGRGKNGDGTKEIDGDSHCLRTGHLWRLWSRKDYVSTTSARYEAFRKISHVTPTMACRHWIGWTRSSPGQLRGVPTISGKAHRSLGSGYDLQMWKGSCWVAGIGSKMFHSSHLIHQSLFLNSVS